jgi:uncharacterized membrane protein YwaF
MLVLITIIAIGTAMALIMILAASVLSSHISSMECEYLADEFTVKQSDPDSPAGEASP